MSAAIIRVTPVQAEAVEWALGAMGEYWRDHDAEGVTENEFEEPVPATWTLPRVEKGVLTLSDWTPVNEDLSWRVGVQHVHMTEENIVVGDLSGTTFISPQRGHALMRSYVRLAELIDHGTS